VSNPPAGPRASWRRRASLGVGLGGLTLGFAFAFAALPPMALPPRWDIFLAKRVRILQGGMGTASSVSRLVSIDLLLRLSLVRPVAGKLDY
jgi:hypothetical protein